MAFRNLMDSVKNFFGPNNSFFNGPRAEEEAAYNPAPAASDSGYYAQPQQQAAPQQSAQPYAQPAYDPQPQQSAYQASAYQHPYAQPAYQQNAYQQPAYQAQPYQKPAQPQMQQPAYSASPLQQGYQPQQRNRRSAQHAQQPQQPEAENVVPFPGIAQQPQQAQPAAQPQQSAPAKQLSACVVNARSIADCRNAIGILRTGDCVIAVMDSIADQAEELETRQDIAGRYDQIVADQRQAIATAQKTAAAAEIDRDAHAAKATELKGQLEQMKTEDDATELRLKAALDAVEAREASSRETGNRLVRRLEDSKRIRDKVKTERDAGIAAAQQTVDATRAQLETLRHEYAELQRNPSANPANYTVRTSELSMQISDTADALRKAEEDVPRITADLEHSLAAAEQAVEQAQAPIADAKRAHKAVTTEADAARDELQTAKTAAATRQRELREKITAEDKARRDQEQTIANAQADAAHAQSIIEQATEVHDHPEITESLAGSLARDKAEHAETEREVAQLEAAEDAVRERTRDSRIKFTGAIVCIVAAILVIILVWLFASK